MRGFKKKTEILIETPNWFEKNLKKKNVHTLLYCKLSFAFFLFQSINTQHYWQLTYTKFFKKQFFLFLGTSLCQIGKIGVNKIVINLLSKKTNGHIFACDDYTKCCIFYSKRAPLLQSWICGVNVNLCEKEAFDVCHKHARLLFLQVNVLFNRGYINLWVQSQH